LKEGKFACISDFIQNHTLTYCRYLAAAVVIAFYVPYKIWYRTPFIRAHNMDLVAGRREMNIEQLIAEERAERESWPTWKRWYKFFC